MKMIYELNLNDIKTLIADHFNIEKSKITVIDMGNDKGDGPYPGTGYFCHIAAEVNHTDLKVREAQDID